MNSDEYEKLAMRITDTENVLDKLASKFASLRGLIHRKFTGDIEPAQKPEKEKVKYDDGLDSLRGTPHDRTNSLNSTSPK
ncbi:unnamed protein product [marine sediment metagenome]|uniref:Uncharacterized protein n=1 Tax=marine sediment metagenome TaxID=412755 RepID=X1MUY2_9ZZZZ